MAIKLNHPAVKQRRATAHSSKGKLCCYAAPLFAALEMALHLSAGLGFACHLEAPTAFVGGQLIEAFNQRMNA